MRIPCQFDSNYGLKMLFTRCPILYTNIKSSLSNLQYWAKLLQYLAVCKSIGSTFSKARQFFSNIECFSENKETEETEKTEETDKTEDTEKTEETEETEETTETEYVPKIR